MKMWEKLYFIKRWYRLIPKISKKLYLLEIYYRIALPFSHKRVELDSEAARETLEHFSPRPMGQSITRNHMDVPFKYNLQIIVPAYNVEGYLKECIDSILQQKTKYSYKVIIVDDGSTDRTGAVADTYVSCANVQIIHQENRGISGARNAGLQTICAEYISFVDADDKMVQGAIELLMETAISKDADIVQGSYYDLYINYRYAHQVCQSLKRVHSMGELLGFACGKVYKSSLFSTICFPEGFVFEDSINLFLVYPQAEKAYLIPEFVYIYRQTRFDRVSRISVNRPKNLDTYWITEQLSAEHELLDLPYDQEYYEEFLHQFLINGIRLKKMPEKVKTSVFFLTVDILEKYGFRGSDKYKTLEKIARMKDYGAYDLYCRTH